MKQPSPILKTLAFFRIYNHPLTLLELWERLIVEREVSWEEFKNDLAELLNKGVVVETRGFFFLAGSVAPVEKRIERILWENPKMQIAERAAKILRVVPFIKLIAVCNTLSFGVSKKESDIDFFIVARVGRLWLVRALSVGLVFLCGLYRRQTKVENKICLSFFIDEKNLDLQKLALPEVEGLPDIYLIYWITQLIPLINREKTLEKFWGANLWIKKYLANWDFTDKEKDYRKTGENRLLNFKRRSWEIILGGFWGEWLEKCFRNLQLMKMRGKKYSRRFESGTAVIVSDEILKFHEEDRRELYRREWGRQ